MKAWLDPLRCGVPGQPIGAIGLGGAGFRALESGAKSYSSRECAGETHVIPRARRRTTERPDNARYAETIARVRGSTRGARDARRPTARAARHPGRLAARAHAHA